MMGAQGGLCRNILRRIHADLRSQPPIALITMRRGPYHWYDQCTERARLCSVRGRHEIMSVSDWGRLLRAPLGAATEARPAKTGVRHALAVCGFTKNFSGVARKSQDVRTLSRRLTPRRERVCCRWRGVLHGNDVAEASRLRRSPVRDAHPAGASERPRRAPSSGKACRCGRPQRQIAPTDR